MTIRQGARPFKTPREHETEPGRDVSWLPHLPVSGTVKLLSWGVTLGVLCMRVSVCARARVCVVCASRFGTRECAPFSLGQSKPQLTKHTGFSHCYTKMTNILIRILCCQPRQNHYLVYHNIFEWHMFQGNTNVYVLKNCPRLG